MQQVPQGWALASCGTRRATPSPTTTSSRTPPARVTLSDQSSYKAELVGAFPDRDLAVLKIVAPAGKAASPPVGSSRDLQVGQQVYAIGNPFG